VKEKRMKAISVGVWMCLVLTTTGRSDDRPAADDMKSVQGLWEVTEHTPQGEPKVTYTKVVFTDDKLVMHSTLGGRTYSVECTFKLSTGDGVKRIDFGPSKERTYPGLYEIKDGKLRICYRGPGSSRPKNFDDKLDGTAVTTFLVLKLKPGI
jgi:uncharacterized protein (TIGR03067 family)